MDPKLYEAIQSLAAVYRQLEESQGGHTEFLAVLAALQQQVNHGGQTITMEELLRELGHEFHMASTMKDKKGALQSWEKLNSTTIMLK